MTLEAIKRGSSKALSYRLLPVLVTLVLVGALLFWYVEKSGEEFASHQQALMSHSVTGTARLISLFLDENRRRVRLFAEEQSEAIRALAASPDDEGLRAQMADRAAKHFPSYFAFTVADEWGDLLLDDFDGEVDSLCVDDIREFASGGAVPDAFIHPNPRLYHFDIMARWHAGNGQRGIFFISFPAAILADILTNSELHDHRLLLLYKEDPGLIEVAAEGTRLDLNHDFHLTAEERARIGASASVAGSRWTLADLPAQDLFARHQTDVLIKAAMIFLVFLLFSGVMYWLIFREERRRSAAERALQRSYGELEASVEARTRELSDAKSEAERATQVKSHFLAAASHDLRQPLQTIALLNGVLARKSQSPETRRIVTEQRAVVDSMTSILNRLLDLSRLDAGGISPARTTFPVRPLLDKIVGDYRAQAKEKGLRLRSVASSLTLNSDPELLERILDNLISNAIRYTETGGVLLGCRRRGGKLRVEVWDTGPGIPVGQRELIFEAFYQMNNPAREARKGLGFGLSIAQQLAGLLGHPLDLRSVLGKGSVFSVEVPLVQQAGPSEAGAGPAEPKAGLPPGKTLLVVEDDPRVLDSLRHLLEILGCGVETAHDAQAALSLVEQKGLRPDLVLADYRLPGRWNGMELIEQIRKILGREVPSLLLTGDTSPEVQRVLSASRIPAQYKPVDSDRLAAVIERLLRSDA
ncbi:MAG: ATP-binding protein [Pseudomonadota bacterium]|nr:ATP-binding protein [Pseudomonadota bacterium]